MKIRNKGETAIDTETTPKRESIDNKLELLKYSVDVRSRLRRRITSDFVLCKLSEQDKIGVTEMTVNAYLAERQIINIIHRAKKWEYDPKTLTWTQTKVEGKEKRVMEEIKDKVFSTYMTKIEMCAILNRNVQENHMVNVLSGLRESEMQAEEEEAKEDGMVKKLMKKWKKKDEKEEENK